MSALSRFLVWDKHPAKMSDKGGLKTPSIMSVAVDPQLTPLCVSRPDGDFMLVRNAGTGEQRVAFFEVEPEDEDEVQAHLTDFLFEVGFMAGWGNVAVMPVLSGELVEQIADYFEAFGLDLNMVHCGRRAYEAMREAGIVSSLPEKDLPQSASKAHMEEATRENDIVGRFDERSIYYNPHLDDKVVFSVEPDKVGLFTRIRDHGSVFVHAPERSVVIVKIGDPEEVEDEFSQQDTHAVEETSEEG